MESKTTTMLETAEASAVIDPGSSDPLNSGFPAPERVSTTGDAPDALGSSALILVASVFGCGLNYLFGIYLARVLGPTDFGLYALGLSLFNILILFAPLSLDTSVMKFVSQSLDRDKTGRIGPYITAASGMALLFGSALGVCLALLAHPLSEKVFGKPDLATVLTVLAVGIPGAAVSAVLLSSLRALHDVRRFVSIKYVVEPGGKFALAGLALWMGWGLAGVLGAVLAVLTLTAGLAIACLLRMTDVRSRHDGSGWRRTAPALLAFSFPLVISNLFGVFAPRSDMLFVGAWFPSRDVGVYSAASQTAAILGLIMTAFHSAVIPMVGTLFARKDRVRLKSLYGFTSRWTLALSILIFIYFVLFGREILHLFGEDFTKGVPWLIILAAGYLVSSASGPATATIIMAGYPGTIMMNSIVMGLLLIGANMVLIPRYGPLGAAWAVSLNVIAGSILCVAEARRLCGVIPFSRGMVKSILAGALTLAVGMFLRSEHVLSSAAAEGFAATAIFGAALLVMKVEAEDREALRGLARKVPPLARWFPSASP